MKIILQVLPSERQGRETTSVWVCNKYAAINLTANSSCLAGLTIKGMSNSLILVDFIHPQYLNVKCSKLTALFLGRPNKTCSP